MRRLPILICLLLSTGAAMAAETLLPLIAPQVEDGDTLLVSIEGETQRIQLVYIDAPENVDNPKLQRDLARTGLARDRLLALGQKSTAHLAQLLASGASWTLSYQPAKRDRYGRLSGDLLDGGGASLSDTLVGDGFAMPLERAPIPEERRERLRRAQQQAEAAAKGLWRLDPEATRAWSGR